LNGATAVSISEVRAVKMTENKRVPRWWD